MSTVVTTQADDLRAFFARAKPYYRELFNMAHAICGNYELAEYAVQSAILECFRQGGLRSRAGLHENLRVQTRARALEQANIIDDAELTWDGFREDAIDGAQGDGILQAASQESVDGRRMLMLRYGCGLRTRDIAHLTGIPASQVTGVLTRFESRVKRRLPPRERARAESRIARSARAWLERQGDGVPDPGSVYRSLKAELMETGAPGRRVSRWVFRVLAVVLALFLAALFWLLMILLEPPQMEEPGQIAVETAAPTAAVDDFSAVE